MYMIFYLLFYTVWAQTLAPSSVLPSQKAYSGKGRVLYYAIDLKKNIYFAGCRERLRDKVQKNMPSKGGFSMQSYKVRWMTEDTLRKLSCPDGLEKGKWDELLQRVRTRQWGQPTLKFLSIKDNHLLISFFESLPKDKYQKLYFRDSLPRKEVTRIFFLWSGKRAHFARSGHSLRSSLWSTEGISLAKERSRKPFCFQSVLLEDLRTLRIPQGYEQEWERLLKSGDVLNWTEKAASYIRDHILRYLSRDKVKDLSYKELVKSQKEGQKWRRRGFCLYRDPQDKAYYINRDFYDLKVKLERNYNLGGPKKPIYYLSEDVVKGTRYGHLVDNNNRNILIGIRRREREKIVNELFELFKDRLVIHRSSPVQEDDDEVGEREENDGDNAFLDTGQMVNKESTEERIGEDNDELMDTEESEDSSAIGMQKENVLRFLFMSLPYDWLHLESFFSEFNVLNPRSSTERNKAYLKYLNEMTTYSWIRYLLHFTPYIRKEYLFNLGVLFYGQKVMQDTGIEEIELSIYHPTIDRVKIPITLKKESLPLFCQFNCRTVGSLLWCPLVYSGMEPLGNEEKCDLRGGVIINSSGLMRRPSLSECRNFLCCA